MRPELEPPLGEAERSGAHSFVADLRYPSRGIHADLTTAINAAKSAFAELSELSVQSRKQLIAAIRTAALERVDELARRSVAETGLGRFEDKVLKNRLAINKTPGVELLEVSTMRCDEGICIEDLSPLGVIGVITPCTNPSETIINNAIGMIAAGNSMVICPHPSAREVSLYTVDLLNRACAHAGGPLSLINVLESPSQQQARELIVHPELETLTVTGGPAVVELAMGSKKNVIAAGPGNPPAVVDETADVAAAAQALVQGASFDNNVVCVDEKQVLCVAAVVDDLISNMQQQGAHLISAEELRHLEALVLKQACAGPRESVVDKSWVGKDAARYLDAIGVRYEDEPRLIIARTPDDHPFVWTELLMPILPIVSCPNADAAIDLALRTERGNRHTAVIHSHDIRNISKMSRLARVSVFVANGTGVDGLGAKGEGHTSFTIASPTGHGLTTARTFARRVRTTALGAFARA